MDGFECGVLFEESVKFLLLAGSESRRPLAHGGEAATIALKLRRDGTGQVHEVVVDDAHDMEAVSDDFGIGEVSADDVAVRAGEVDADHLHLVPSAQCSQVGSQVGNAPARPDVEDPVVAQVAERGAEALGLVQGMLVDTEVLRAVQRESLIGLAACELGVDAADCGSSEPFVTGNGARADAVVMVLENLLPEGFGTVSALDDTGQFGQEATQAAGALEASGVDVQNTRLSEGLKVASLAQIAALAANAGAKAVRATPGFKR